MARWEIVAWQEIPAAVEVTDEGGQVTLQLSERFQSLIDSVAMQQGLEASDAYLEQWRKLPGGERPGSAQDVGEAVVAEIEARFMDYIGRAFRRP
jgi:hypothetical protein